jgi:hypothetical protein
MLFDLLSSLGLGEQLTTAAVFALIGWYILRGKSFIGTIISAVGTVTSIVLGVLVVLAVSVALGWFDPQPSVFLSDVSAWFREVIDLTDDVVLDWLSRVVS